MFKKHFALVLDAPDFVHHSRVTHVRNFSHTRGLSGPPWGPIRLCPILCPVPTQMELD